MFSRDTLYCILIGVAAGTVSGLTGLGGGVILVPMILGLLSLGQHKSHGTSLAVVGVTAVAASLQYARQGYLDVQLALGLLAGSVVGVTVGARLMGKIPAKQLRQGFGILLLVVGIRMITR